ncbi:MAG TPA: hypothetical protein VLH56_05345 [Dissulfurispiraceae bacterium]|nr:hypothetical protein [Dissulfurispiraceae bacterium]
MSIPQKITAHEAYIKVEGDAAILVCAYDDDEKCRGMLLEGAVLLSSLKTREEKLPKDTEIVFYCA